MRTSMRWPLRSWPVSFGLYIVLLLGSGLGSWAVVTNRALVATLHTPAATRNDQADVNSLGATDQAARAFKEAFERGNTLFSTTFNALDGVGAYVEEGQHFTRLPRADLRGYGEWATHFPVRDTGPNAQSCNACHNQPTEGGAGSIASNVIRDPLHTGRSRGFIQRNTPHLFALGALQRLAEEMTEVLHAIHDAAQQRTCETGEPVTSALRAKGVDFGKITVIRTGRTPCTVEVETSQVEGIAADLVIRPFQWKGSVASIRAFNREAAHNELGMQAVELVGDGEDGDYDDVVDELTVGDLTALTIYLAAQPRPTTRMELAALGFIDPLSDAEMRATRAGQRLFSEVGCAACHIPHRTLDDPIFSEPSQNPHFRDTVFPGGQDPVARGVDPAAPIRFDLTHDQPDNQMKEASGKVMFRLGALKQNQNGGAIVELFGDLKRHDMGPELAESIDEVATGASVFLTANLWGVGSTAPYLHDGRATTLTEAILAHGGEAAPARAAFRDLPPQDQADLIAFLNNLVLFKIEAEEE
jgi:cytochrome c peroxidase